MYAVFTSGGKQYKAEAGAKLKLEKLPEEIGSVVAFDQVLLIDDGQNIKLGAPYLPNIKVVAKITQQGRHDKIHIVKFRRRKHSMRRTGHRQYFTEVEITGIQTV